MLTNTPSQKTHRKPIATPRASSPRPCSHRTDVWVSPSGSASGQRIPSGSSQRETPQRKPESGYCLEISRQTHQQAQPQSKQRDSHSNAFWVSPPEPPKQSLATRWTTAADRPLIGAHNSPTKRHSIPARLLGYARRRRITIARPAVLGFTCWSDSPRIANLPSGGRHRSRSARTTVKPRGSLGTLPLSRAPARNRPGSPRRAIASKSRSRFLTQNRR